jgi:hypothetical protein
MEFVSRPQRQENEDDLLRFQEEFLKSQSKSSVSIVRLNKQADIVKGNDGN